MLARPWPVLALLFIANLLNFFDRQIPAAVTEPLRREFGLTDAALGWLGTAFIFLYAAAGIPFGRLADRCSRKRILAWGVGLWSLMTAATGLSRGFWSFFVSRMGVGLGEAACAPAATSLIGDLWGPEKRARALSVFMLGLPAGLALSYLVSGLIAHYYGWRQAFLVAAVPGFAVAVLIAGIREPARGAGDTIQVGSRRRQGRPLRVVLAIPTMRWIILTGAVHNFMLYALSYFMSSLLVRHHGMDLRGAGAVSGFVTGIMGGAGMLLGGWLADASFARWRRGRLLTGAAGAALSLPAFWLAAAQPEGEALSFACWMGTAWLLM